MMNCFCGMVDRRKAFSLISSWDFYQNTIIKEYVSYFLLSVGKSNHLTSFLEKKRKSLKKTVSYTVIVLPTKIVVASYRPSGLEYEI